MSPRARWSGSASSPVRHRVGTVAARHGDSAVAAPDLGRPHSPADRPAGVIRPTAAVGPPQSAVDGVCPFGAVAEIQPVTFLAKTAADCLNGFPVNNESDRRWPSVGFERRISVVNPARSIAELRSRVSSTGERHMATRKDRAAAPFYEHRAQGRAGQGPRRGISPCGAISRRLSPPDRGGAASARRPSIDKKLAAIDAQLDGAEPLARLHLLQEKKDLEEELARAGRRPGPDRPREAIHQGRQVLRPPQGHQLRHLADAPA